jgi:hypothetical protein
MSDIKMDTPLATSDFQAKCVRIFTKELDKLVIGSGEAGDLPIIRAQLNYNEERGIEFQLMYGGSYHLEDYKTPKEKRKLWRNFAQTIFDPKTFLKLCGWLREQEAKGIIDTHEIIAEEWTWELVE